MSYDPNEREPRDPRSDYRHTNGAESNDAHHAAYPDPRRINLVCGQCHQPIEYTGDMDRKTTLGGLL